MSGGAYDYVETKIRCGYFLEMIENLNKIVQDIDERMVEIQKRADLECFKNHTTMQRINRLHRIRVDVKRTLVTLKDISANESMLSAIHHFDYLVCGDINEDEFFQKLKQELSK
jgi:hypothetical protein